jgi:hypothetical protein
MLPLLFVVAWHNSHVRLSSVYIDVSVCDSFVDIFVYINIYSNISFFYINRKTFILENAIRYHISYKSPVTEFSITLFFIHFLKVVIRNDNMTIINL